MRHNLSYLAGVIDGEGHFALIKAKNGQGRPYLRPLIIITQKQKPMLEWVLTNYGGRLYYTKPTLNRGALRQWYRWYLSGRKAVDLAKQLQPYLIEKQEQVKRICNIEYDKRGWMIKRG